MKDLIIVGAGLAGIALAEEALQRGLDISVFDDGLPGASMVAGGLYNPVVLKRYSATWNASPLMALLPVFYQQLESRIGIQVNHRLPLLRRFSSVEDQNNWFAASDRPVLSEFLSPKIGPFHFEGISSEFGFGQVLQTGYVDTALLIDQYKSYLSDQGLLRKAVCSFQQMELLPDRVVFEDITARNIIFAEGFGVRYNPFFNYLPLDGTKGELLIIKADDLKLEGFIVKANVFLVPLGNGLFKAGATYNPHDKTSEPTAFGRMEIESELRVLLSCDFAVVDHLAGIRPSTKDRRALVGTQPEHAHVHILNGLGSRGVMLAPFLSKALLDKITTGKELPAEVDISRYRKLFHRPANGS